VIVSETQQQGLGNNNAGWLGRPESKRIGFCKFNINAAEHFHLLLRLRTPTKNEVEEANNRRA